MYLFREHENANEYFSSVERMFDNWSKNYDDDVITRYEYTAPTVCAWQLYKHLQRKDKMDAQQIKQLTVLDVACGTGFKYHFFTKAG